MKRKLTLYCLVTIGAAGRCKSTMAAAVVGSRPTMLCVDIEDTLFQHLPLTVTWPVKGNCLETTKSEHRSGSHSVNYDTERDTCGT